LLRCGDTDNVLQLVVHLIHPTVEDAGMASKSAAMTATFWLALAKVGRGASLQLMAAAMALARARALVKLIVVARCSSSICQAQIRTCCPS
jgi:hypothetical protein